MSFAQRMEKTPTPKMSAFQRAPNPRPNLHSPVGVGSRRGCPQRGGTRLGDFVPIWPVTTRHPHMGTNTPKFVPPRWGQPRFDPTQTGLCKFGRGFGARWGLTKKRPFLLRANLVLAEDPNRPYYGHFCVKNTGHGLVLSVPWSPRPQNRAAGATCDRGRCELPAILRLTPNIASG